MRRWLAGSLSIVVLSSGFSMLPGVATPPAVAAAADPDGDVPDAQSVPVHGLSEPDDPTAAIDGLPDQFSDVPRDEVSEVAAEPTWTDVPGMPVDVKVPEDALPPTLPAEGTDPDDSGAAEEPTEEQTDGATDTPSTSPTDTPSTSPTEPPSDAPSDVPAEPEVEVSWDRPADVSQGVVLLSVEPAAEPVDPADAVVAGAGVRVDYSGFDQLYGAGWSDRLLVRAYPACYTVTPELPECSEGIQVPAVNDTDGNQLAFTTITAETLTDGLSDLEVSSGTSDTPDSSDSSDSDDTDATTDPAQDAAPSSDTTSERRSGFTVQPVLATGEPTETAAATDGVVYALASAPGAYGAVPVSPTGEWQVGAGSGEFSYSYGFAAPPSVGGATPSLGLAYSSAAVDGMTNQYGGQASPAGLGWSLEPGFISREYATCREDNPASGTMGFEKDDLCWTTDADGDLVEEFTLSLNGRVARLVPVAGSGPTTQWRLKSDPGWRVDRVRDGSSITPAPANADDDNETFRVTTPDGTQYWFGYDTAGGAPATDSVWKVPVYANDADEPCWDPAKAEGNRYCQQGWRWNLDRVVDRSGNVTRYTYAAETNHYRRWDHPGGPGADPVWTTPYHRGGLLAKVEYGFRGATGTPRQVIDFERVFRCEPKISDPDAACSAANARNNPGIWPDVPTDLVCNADDTACVVSPSFFTMNRYHKVITMVRDQGGTSQPLVPVDEYLLKFTMPDPDGAGESTPDLWLAWITRTGKVGGSKALPVVRFTGNAQPNKIVETGEKYEKFRLNSVRNETGGRIDVTYGHADDTYPAVGADARWCDWDYVDPLGRWGSKRECFAVRSRNTENNNIKTEWFHKYVVTRLAVGDDTLGLRLGTPAADPISLAKVGVYEYEYLGTPAWRFAGTRNVPTGLESWSDWRGYETTIIHTRATNDFGQLVSGDVAQQRITRFRGMNQAPANPTQVDNPTDPRPDVYLDTQQYPGTDAAAGEPEDNNIMEGLTAESSTLNGDGTLIERAYTAYGSIVSIERDGEKQPRSARIRFPAWAETHTAIYNAGSPPTQTGTRTHKVDYGYEGQETTLSNRHILAGAPRSVTDEGDPTDPDDDVCTLTTYDHNTSPWIRVPIATETYEATCPNGAGEGGGELLARSEVVYDDGATLTKGLPTDTATWTTPDADPVTGVDLVESHTTYDNFGRVTTTVGPREDEVEVVNGIERPMSVETVTQYNPGGSSSDALAGTKVTQKLVLDNPRTTPYSPSTATEDIVSTTTLDPGRGLPLTVTDPNGGITRITYNPLGQTLEVRNPSQGPTDPASVKYTYTIPTTADEPSRILTQTLRSGSTYDDAYSFYDGWGRLVETQAPQPEAPAQRVFTAAGYDERGLVRFTLPATASLSNTDTFTKVVNTDPDASVAEGGAVRYTQTTYDGAGRPTLVQDKSYAAVKATSLSKYRGELTTVDPPVGGTTLTEADVWGRPTRVELHETSTITGTPVDAVDYTYTLRGELDTAAKTLDDVDYTWSYGYDMTGRQIWAHDPDTGATTTSYDDASNPVTITTGPIAPLGEVLDTTTHPYHPVITAPSSVITTRYDRLGRPTEKVDETNPSNPIEITAWGYDALGVSNSIGQSTSTSHPITGIADPLFNGPKGAYAANTLAYDSQGQPTSTSETYPVWLTGEPADDNPAHDDDTITRVWNTEYNKAGQPTTVDYPAVPGLPAATIGYDYTTGGRVRTISLDEAGDPLRLAHVIYNNIGRTANLNSGTYTTGGAFQHGLKRAYAFEADTGRFDTLKARITPTTTGGGAGTEFLAFSLDYTYDAGGNPTTIQGTATNPGAAQETGYWCYGYDGLNRLTRARTGSTSSCTTPGSAPASVTGATYDLTYDHAADRLTSVVDNLHTTGGQNAEQLRVDYETGDANADDEAQRPHHNTKLATQLSLIELLAWPREMPAPGTIHNDDQGRIERWSPDVALLDLLGQPIIGDQGPISSGFTYEYNNLGQLEHTQAEALPPLVPEITSSSSWYAYRPDGTRLARARNFIGLGVQRATTVYLADGTEITKTTAVNKTETVRTFTTPSGTPVATQTYDSSTDDPHPTNHEADWTWLTADAQGSLRLTYTHSPTGTGTITRPTYYPYGDPTTPGPPETPNGAGYLNKHHDVTGDIRLDHRNYTPNLNTLTTPDPLLNLADPQSFNPYGYARNNPLGLSDPNGLYPINEDGTRVDDPGPWMDESYYYPDYTPSSAPPSEDELREVMFALYDAYEPSEAAEADKAHDLSLADDPELLENWRHAWYTLTIVNGPGDCRETFICRLVTSHDFHVTVLESLAAGGIVKALAEGAMAARAARTGEAALASNGATTTASLVELRAIADATVPYGIKRAAWGSAVWGRGAGGADALVGARTSEQLLNIPGMSIDTAIKWRNFYVAASAAEKGAGTSGARVQLMNDVIRTLAGL